MGKLTDIFKVVGAGTAGAAAVLGAEAALDPNEAEGAAIDKVRKLPTWVAQQLDSKQWVNSSTNPVLSGQDFQGQIIERVYKQKPTYNVSRNKWARTPGYDEEKRLLRMVDPESGEATYRLIDRDYLHTMASKTGADIYVNPELAEKSVGEIGDRAIRSVKTKAEGFGGYNMSDTLEEARNARRAYIRKQIDLYGEASDYVETVKLKTKGEGKKFIEKYVNMPVFYVDALKIVKKQKIDEIEQELIKGYALMGRKATWWKRNREETLLEEYERWKSLRFMSKERTGFRLSERSLAENPLYQPKEVPDNWQFGTATPEQERDATFDQFMSKWVGETRRK